LFAPRRPPRRPTAPQCLEICSVRPNDPLPDETLEAFSERHRLRLPGLRHARPSSAATHLLLLIAPERSFPPCFARS
jgi:hypothetical protein